MAVRFVCLGCVFISARIFIFINGGGHSISEAVASTSRNHAAGASWTSDSSRADRGLQRWSERRAPSRIIALRWDSETFDLAVKCIENFCGVRSLSDAPLRLRQKPHPLLTTFSASVCPKGAGGGDGGGGVRGNSVQKSTPLRFLWPPCCPALHPVVLFRGGCMRRSV